MTMSNIEETAAFTDRGNHYEDHRRRGAAGGGGRKKRRKNKQSSFRSSMISPLLISFTSLSIFGYVKLHSTFSTITSTSTNADLSLLNPHDLQHHGSTNRHLFDCSEPSLVDNFNKNYTDEDGKCVYFHPVTFFAETNDASHKTLGTHQRGGTPLSVSPPSLSSLPTHLLKQVQAYWDNELVKDGSRMASRDSSLSPIDSNVSKEDLFVYSIRRDVGVYVMLEWTPSEETNDGYQNQNTKLTMTKTVKNMKPSRPLEPSWPISLMGLHIHKCGGTTVGMTFNKLAKESLNQRQRQKRNDQNRNLNQHQHPTTLEGTGRYKVTYMYAKQMRDATAVSKTTSTNVASSSLSSLSLVNQHKGSLQRVLWSQQQQQQQQTTSSISNHTSVDHVAFTFLRDPVDRFLSSAREFMISRNKKKICTNMIIASGNKSNGNQDLGFQNRNLTGAAHSVLRCILDKLLHPSPTDRLPIGSGNGSSNNNSKGNRTSTTISGLQLDQHFAPATVSLYMFSVLEPSIRIAIFPLDTGMASFRSFFGLENRKAQTTTTSATTKEKSSSSSSSSQTGKRFDRNSRMVSIPIDVIDNVNIHAMDSNMIRDVCQLYALDVHLLRHLGMSTRHCDAYI